LLLGAALFLAGSAGCGGGSSGSKPGNEPGATVLAPTAEATAAPTPAPTALPLAVPGAAAADRIVIQKIGVNAPITTRKVGADGQMPNPDGPDDIAFYDFDNGVWPGVGGLPGSGGNIVLAGHVDWGAQHGNGCKNNTVRPPCQAVLWDLGRLAAGDQLEINVGGTVYKYQITGTKSYAASYSDWGGVFAAAGQESLTIVTCSGDFNPSTREYGSRLVVAGVRVA